MIKQFYLTLSGATTQGEGRPENVCNEGVLHIPPNPQDWSLVIKLFRILDRVGMQSVYSTA